MNQYGSVEVPDHVPDEWQQLYGSAPATENVEGPVYDERRARAILIRLFAWVGAVTATAVVVMWPAISLPRPLAVAVFVVLGVAAGMVLARWVLDTTDDDTTDDDPDRSEV